MCTVGEYVKVKRSVNPGKTIHRHRTGCIHRQLFEDRMDVHVLLSDCATSIIGTRINMLY